MIRRVANVLVWLGLVGIAVVLEVIHGQRVNGLDSLMREGEYWSELGLFADGVKSRKETGVARQECRKVLLKAAAYKQTRLAIVLARACNHARPPTN